MPPIKKLLPSSQAFWLGVWFLLALIIRLLFLASKPIWMDEIATIIFTLGNSSFLAPLDRVMSLNDLLAPLQPSPEATVGSVIKYLIEEDNHPPAYFALAHPWMDLFPPERGIASPWAVRALPALLGALTAPALYLAARIGFRSNLAGQIAAAFMAVSPFGVAMAQEARHYSFATLMVCLCLGCFVAGAWTLRPTTTKPISPAFMLLWIGVNALAFATHYFAILTLLAEALVLLGLAGYQARFQPGRLWQPHWRRVYWVMLGTAAACLAWLPVLLNFYGSDQSSGLAIDFSQPIQWINPIAQMLAGLIFMVITPITNAQGLVGWIGIGLSAMFLLPLLLWTLPLLWKGRRLLGQSDSGRFGLLLVGGFVVAAIGLFFAVSYGAGLDITRGHRYNFVFFPGSIALLGGLLSVYWPDTDGTGEQSASIPVMKRRISGRRSVSIIWGASFLSAIFVITNLALPKYYNPKRFVQTIQAESSYPVLIGAPTGIETDKPSVIAIELLSVGWEIKRHFDPIREDSGWETPPQFFIWALPEAPTTPPEEALAAILQEMPRPYDLWFLNVEHDLSGYGCSKMERAIRGGHNYTHYQCQ